MSRVTQTIRMPGNSPTRDEIAEALASDQDAMKIEPPLWVLALIGLGHRCCAERYSGRTLSELPCAPNS